MTPTYAYICVSIVCLSKVRFLIASPTQSLITVFMLSIILVQKLSGTLNFYFLLDNCKYGQCIAEVMYVNSKKSPKRP